MEKLNSLDKKLNNSSFKNGCNDISSSRSPHSDPAVVSDNQSHNEIIQNNIDSILQKEHSLSSRYVDDEHEHENENVEQVTQEIDRFTHTLITVDDKSKPPEIPGTVETFSRIIESRIAKFSVSSGARNVLGKMTEDDSFFIEAVMRIAKLTNVIGEFSSSSTTSDSLNRTSIVLQHAMAFMEDEFRLLLDLSNTNINNNNNNNNNTVKDNKDEHGSDRCMLQPGKEGESISEDEYPGYPPEVVTKMSRYASAMISAGYETECCQVYSLYRMNTLNNQLNKLEYEKINMDDIWKMNWESLEGEIKRWVNVVKNCSNVIFPGEKRLCDAVFVDNPTLSKSIFSSLSRTVVIQLLDFAEAASMTQRAAEKLFKFLDMYESIRDLIPAIADCCSEDFGPMMREEIRCAADRIGDAVHTIFSDLENSIKNDSTKATVAGGAVHPLTRYVMNYVNYACEYKESLEQIFAQRTPKSETSNENSHSNTAATEVSENDIHDAEAGGSTTPFSKQLVIVMDLLDAYLEDKSKLYRDPSLRYIFLMNNGRYILQKVKRSVEIAQVMGENWCRRRSTIVRQFHKNYQRETWVKLLHTLSHEGLTVAQGKVNKPMLKERFKSFNTMFDEIHKTQSTWVVSDEQLQSELQVSISAVVIPAYRSFLGRFRQYLENSKQVEKYIKYQPEDIETLIEDFFAGNHSSMAKRR